MSKITTLTHFIVIFTFSIALFLCLPIRDGALRYRSLGQETEFDLDAFGGGLNHPTTQNLCKMLFTPK